MMNKSFFKIPGVLERYDASRHAQSTPKHARWCVEQYTMDIPKYTKISHVPKNLKTTAFIYAIVKKYSQLVVLK